MRNVIRRLMGKPVQLSPKQEEKMARVYARAQAQIAEREAEAAKARAEYEAFMASQGLPVQPAQAAPTSIREAFQMSVEGLKQEVESHFDDRRDVLDPGPDADLNHPPEEEVDPQRRAAIAAAERAAREVARQPYLAPGAAVPSFTRIATEGRRQLEDV